MSWDEALGTKKEARQVAPSVPVRVNGGTAYGRSALDDECQRVARSQEGERNDTLNRAAFAAGQLVAGGELSEGEVEAALTQAAMQCGLGDHEVRGTLASALSAGKSEPRTAPPREFERKPKASRAQETDAFLDALAAEDADDDSCPIWQTTPETETEEKPLSVLAERWVRLGDDNGQLLTTEPPPQTWLLKQTHRGREVGVFPRGRTGLLTATGGVGKTYSLIDLAVAVALGGEWFGEFRAVGAGHVLLALGEEDLDEARRRLWRVCNSREMSLDERREIAQRIDLLPLAGVPVALSASPAPGVITPTPIYGELCDRLANRGVEWALVILDPLIRWAGGGVEVDNESATRFCQIIEGLCRAPGNPSVLVAHHSSKTSAKDGAADSRGVTGIRDGFRWQASLDPLKSKDGSVQGAKLTCRKSNYSRMFDDVILVKDDEPGTEGTLRVAYAAEAALLGAFAHGQTDEDYAERVMETVAKCPGLKSTNDVTKRTKGKRTAVSDALKDLIRDGKIAVGANGYEVRPDLGR